MQTAPTCASCGTLLPAGQPAAFCTRCLLTGALTPLPDTPPASAEAPAFGAVSPALRVGDYELLAPLAHGGMGSVWHARQVSADRLVAYKTVTSGRLASAAERRRFQTEIEAAAQLDHPGIVPIYEVGEDEGRPFFTMRLMEGGTLRAKAKMEDGGSKMEADALLGGPFSILYPPSSSAQLLAKVARAVHFAHERGILHRDLKPGNILLDAAGEPFVADFGLARRLELDSSLTLSGDVLGTPAYLAPEVAAGGSRHATIASDIYSLGAVLYELLTGRPPFEAETVPALLRKITEEEPVTPNQCLRSRREEAPPGADPTPAAGAPNSSSARSPDTGEPASRRMGIRRSAARTPAAIPRDLETICLKCLAKNPAARYASAAALADDLDRWLRGDPIQARPATPLELGWKWARRHRVGAALLGVAAILPALIIAMLLVMGARVTQEKRLTQQQADKVRQQIVLTRQNLYAADIYIAHDAVEAGNYGLAWQALEKHVTAPALSARAPAQPGRPNLQPPSPPVRTAAAEAEPDLRGFEWYWLRQRAQGDAFRTLAAHNDSVNSLAFSPDGRLLASVSLGGELRVCDWANGRCLATLRAHDELKPDPLDHGHQDFKAAFTVSFSPDGRFLACCSALATRVWRLDQLPHLYAEQHLRGRWALFLKSGELAVSYQWPRVADSEYSSYGNLIGLFDAQLHPVAEPWILTNLNFCLSEDGRWLVGAHRADVELWDLNERRRVRAFRPNDKVSGLALSPDGALLALSYRTCDYIEFWHPHSAQPLAALQGHTVSVGSLAFSPHGHLLASWGGDETIRIWDAVQLKELCRLHGHALGARSVAFAPDGQVLATGGGDGTVRFWNVGPRTTPPAITNARAPLALSPDGRWLAAGVFAGDPVARQASFAVWNLTNRQMTLFTSLPPAALLFPEPGQPLLSVALPAEGAPVEVWANDPETGASARRCRLAEFASPATCLALCGDGRELATGHKDGTLCWWDTNTGRLLTRRQPYADRVEMVRYSPDGRYLMSSTFSPRQVQTWSVPTREPLATNNFPGPTLMSFAFAPDGETCVTGGFRTDLRLWQTATFAPLAVLPRQRAPAGQFAWSPDGRTLAVATVDGPVRFWHLPTHRLLLTLAGFPRPGCTVQDMVFSRNAQWFAACDVQGRLELWSGSHESLSDPVSPK